MRPLHRCSLFVSFLSVFVLAAFAGLGLVIGLILLYYWDQILELFGIQAALLPFL